MNFSSETSPLKYRPVEMALHTGLTGTAHGL